MAVIYWWLIPIIVIAIAFAVWLYLFKYQKATIKKKGVPIAHSGRVTQLPAYRRAYARYKRILLATIIVLTLGLVTAIILSARPVAQNIVSPQQKNRDIMLCLDVSGSMFSVDSDILKTFHSLVDNFQGQRIGLTTFNSSPVTVVPLTDDYDLLRAYLDKGAIGFEYMSKTGVGSTDYKSVGYHDYQALTDGTFANSEGTSLVGDGAASCVNRMGSNEQHRSQSIILATDNEVNGDLIATLPQVAAYAKSKNVRMYAIDPGISDEGGPSEHAELKQSVELTGGLYNTTKNVSVSQIIADISKQEATLFTAAPELVKSDQPQAFVIVLLVVVAGFLVAAWRFRL